MFILCYDYIAFEKPICKYFINKEVKKINNQGPHSQIENDETSDAEYPNENDSEDTETNKTSAIPNFIPQILPDDKIAKGINSLNSKQKKIIGEIINNR